MERAGRVCRRRLQTGGQSARAKPRRGTLRAVLTVLLAAAALLESVPALAAPGDGPGVKGLGYVRRRDCASAVPLLEEANRLNPRPSWAVPLADCYLALGDLVHAGELYHRVAAEKPVRGWLRIDIRAAEAAKRKAADVDARIPRLRFRTSDAYEGLEISVDGKRVADPDAEVRVAPGVRVRITARARDHRDFADTVVLAEGARREVVLRLEPAVEVAPAKPGASAAPSPREPVARRWIGVRYYGVVLPKFVMNLVADGGTNLVIPGGAFTFTTPAVGADITVGLGYLSYRMASTPFKPPGEPDTEWEFIGSSLEAITATVDLMWAFPLDAARRWSFRAGGSVGVGWMFRGALTRVQSYPANGKPGDPATYLECRGPNDPRGTFRYCNALDKDAAHYPGYQEPDWFHGGIRPLIFPWLVLPQLGLTFHPSRSTAIDLDTGVSISGFLTSLGFRVGI